MNRNTSAWAATHAPAGTRWGKKTLALLLGLVLCLTLLPTAAFAADNGKPEMTTVRFETAWSKPDEITVPSKITVALLQNETVYEIKEFSNNGTALIQGEFEAPAADAQGNPYTYTVKETGVDGATLKNGTDNVFEIKDSAGRMTGTWTSESRLTIILDGNGEPTGETTYIITNTYSAETAQPLSVVKRVIDKDRYDLYYAVQYGTAIDEAIPTVGSTNLGKITTGKVYPTNGNYAATAEQDEVTFVYEVWVSSDHAATVTVADEGAEYLFGFVPLNALNRNIAVAENGGTVTFNDEGGAVWLVFERTFKRDENGNFPSAAVNEVTVTDGVNTCTDTETVAITEKLPDIKITLTAKVWRTVKDETTGQTTSKAYRIKNVPCSDATISENDTVNSVMVGDKIEYTITVKNNTGETITINEIKDVFDGAGGLELDATSRADNPGAAIVKAEDGKYTISGLGKDGKGLEIAANGSASVKLTYAVRYEDTVLSASETEKMLVNTATVTYNDTDYSGKAETPVNTNTFNLGVHKTWLLFNRGGHEATLRLCAKGTAVDGTTITITEDKNLTTVDGYFENLPLRDEEGKRITYTVRETTISGAVWNAEKNVFEVKNQAGTVIGQWTVTYSDEDPDDGWYGVVNDYNDVEVPDIEVTKEVTKVVRNGRELTDNTTARTGDTITYTVTIANNTETALSFKISDYLSGSSGNLRSADLTNNGAQSYCKDVENLAAGAQITISAAYTVQKGDGVYNAEDGKYYLINTVTVTYDGKTYTDSVSTEIEKDNTGSGSYTPSYSVTVEKSTNGAVSADRKTASYGTTVTITVTPDKGYTLETLTVTDKNGKEVKLTEKNGKYTFTMPASKVTVKATFMDDNTMLNYFVDVKASDYYYDAVLWAAQNGITSGTDAVHFSPNLPCTRAQIVTFLWRAAGSPVVNYAMNMTDVPADAYYAEAVRWALSEGITTGTTESTFSPNETCTRAQAVAFLFRYAAPEAVTLQELVSGFSDAASVPGYALSAMNWALAEGIVQGDGSRLMPNDSCTRAQIVTFLYRALEK